MFPINFTSSSAARLRLASAVRSSLATVLGIALSGVQAFAQDAPPFDLPDRGVLRLQLGSSVQQGGLHAPRRFVHEPSGLAQAINQSGKCGLALSGSSLATLSAAGGRGSLGLGPDSIGVYDGASGTACYRLTASINESITFGLGTATKGAAIDANAFWRLVLDIEVKRDAEFLLQIRANGTVTDEFRLRSGASIVPGQGSANPGDHIFNCSAASDSGPDAGSRDNCRWVVDALGTDFVLKPLRGEGSWEGGGDFGTAAYANNSLVYLTDAEIGALGCNSEQVPQGTNTNTIGDGVNSAQCAVTRIDPSNVGGQCTTAVGYVFRNIDGEAEGCSLDKLPGEQFAASIAITFPPERATPLGEEPLTEIEFSDGAGGLVPFLPERCFGTVVPDQNGEPTILEVLSQPGFVTDVVPSTPAIDWACVLENGQDYIGSDQMRVRQKFLFWGDIGFARK